MDLNERSEIEKLMKATARRMPTAYRARRRLWRWASLQRGPRYGSFGIRRASL